MVPQMQDFINTIKNAERGQLFVQPDGRLMFLETKTLPPPYTSADTLTTHYGPEPLMTSNTSYTLFLARVEAMLTLKGWDWE